MNLFLLSVDHAQNARWHCDKHVVKMILEAVQIVSSVYWIDRALECHVPRFLTREETKRVTECYKDAPFAYKPTHVNHPVVVWARSDAKNFAYVQDYARALSAEYTFRYGKHHKSMDVMELVPSPKNVPAVPSPQTFVTCMDESYRISNDPVECYRNYYVRAKASFCKWKKRDDPEWFKSSSFEINGFL